MQEIKQRQHITEEMWIALEQENVNSEMFLQILEHTCECTWCAERMASVMETDAQAPPVYLAGEIQQRIGQLDIQAAVTVKKTSKKIQLLMYSLRVGAAVVLSILILGITSNFQNAEFTQIVQSEKEVMQEISEESVLEKINHATDGIAQKIGLFTNKILDGGKEE